MDDFSVPGKPNYYGLPPSPYNFIHPRKRPLSSASPVFVEKDGKIVLVSGASGGSRIISTVLQSVVGMLDWNLNPLESINHLRLHHQLVPNNVNFIIKVVDSS